MRRLPLHLASRSPRRATLLAEAGIPFRLGPFPDVDETPPEGLSPPGLVETLAARKARAAAPLAPDGVVLTADTLVFLGSKVLGKPADPDEARTTLARLSGRTHDVVTGVAVARGRRLRSGASGARVTFRALTAQEIGAYVATREPLDKAGAYGIQGGAADFVVGLEGDVDTVIGLPLALVRRLLAHLGEPVLGIGGPDGR